MVSKEKTCGNCKYVEIVGGRFPIIGCQKTGFVIPHHVDYQAKENQITFWRVPESCPRGDHEVHKSESKASERDWVIKSFSDY